MNDFLDGLFDFNGDGVTDIGEKFIAFKIYEAVTRESENEEDDGENE